MAKIRTAVADWRSDGYAGASPTSVALLRWWFDTDHLVEEADGSLSPFRYYFAQREAVETVIWLHDVRRARDRFDLLRFDATDASPTADHGCIARGSPTSVTPAKAGVQGGSWNAESQTNENPPSGFRTIRPGFPPSRE